MKKIFVVAAFLSLFSFAFVANAQGQPVINTGPNTGQNIILPSNQTGPVNTYVNGTLTHGLDIIPNQTGPASTYVTNAQTNSLSGLSSCSNLTTFQSVVSCTLAIINSIIPIIIAITVVWIIWSAFNLTKSDGEESRKEWRNAILYGIVGLFVMVSVFGLVNILTGTFGFGGNNTINVPNISNSIRTP